MVSYSGFALEGVSIVELIKKVRGLLELHTSFSDWGGWRCCCCQTKKENISKINICRRYCMCSICPFILCLLCKIKCKKWPNTAACGQQKFTCLCLGLLNGSGWFGRGLFGRLSRGCGFGGQWFGSSRAPCSCDWSRRWGRNLLACIQLLLQPLHLLLHPPELIWGGKTQSPTGEPNKQHLMSLLHCRGETAAAQTL